MTGWPANKPTDRHVKLKIHFHVKILPTWDLKDLYEDDCSSRSSRSRAFKSANLNVQGVQKISTDSKLKTKLETNHTAGLLSTHCTVFFEREHRFSRLIGENNTKQTNKQANCSANGSGYITRTTCILNINMYVYSEHKSTFKHFLSRLLCPPVCMFVRFDS